MKTLTLATLALLCCLPCRADEILLKDGRRIAWKAVVDEGDAYSVDTGDEQKMRVKKSEVDRFVVSRDPAAKADGPVSGPLTGASFTVIDPKKASTVDLIQKAATAGQEAWKVVGGKIMTASAVWPKRETVTFDYQLPEEYDLTVVVERVGKGNKDFDIGIVAGGSQCALHVDCYDGTVTCLALLAGGEGEHVNKSVLASGQAKTIKLQVRKAAFAVSVDGKELWKGKVDWTSASLHPAVAPRERGKPFLVAAGGDWRVHQFNVMAPQVAQK